MFYSLLFPVWILLQNKNAGLTNMNSGITSTELDKSVSNDDDKDDKLAFIKKNMYDGFDLHNVSSYTNNNNNTELCKIANYFRKLKQLKILNSPFVSNECKLNCAKEVLEEAREEAREEATTKKNNFWETYDDVFF